MAGAGGRVVLGIAAAAAAGAWALAAAAGFRYGASDLIQDYLSARAVREGLSVYAPLPAGWALAGDPGTVVNDHPPPYILALSPLSLLPYPTAFLMLAAANLAAGVMACAVVGHELGWSPRTVALVAAGLLAHPGTVACLCVGNVSLLLLLPVAFGWRAFRRNRTGCAGGWLGLAAAVKLYPGLLLAGLAGGRAWRGLAVAAGVGIACWAGAAAVVGGDDVLTYARVRAPANAKTYVGSGFNLSVAGAAHRAFGGPNYYAEWLDRVAERPDLAEAMAWVGRVVVGLLVAIGLWRSRREADYADRAVAVLVPGMLLLSPLTWLHAVPMMLVPVAILARTEARGRLIALAVCAAAMCLNDRWVVTRWVAATGGNVPPWLNLLLLAPTWGMLGVLALAASRPRTAVA